MITLIKRADIYGPEPLGIHDVLLVGDKIAAIGDNLEVELPVELTVIDANELKLTPGFIDSHVHILGGGGEGGFKTRTPEATLTTFTQNGVTTVVGTLGTDGITRSLKSLLAKARALTEEGITCFIYTGSYRLPLTTLTGSIMEDIILIDKVIGIGEVALSDHRSSQPTFDEFIRAVADARVGGMLSGKVGIVNVHMGDGKTNLDYLIRAVTDTELPITQFVPTHINRNPELFEAGIEFAQLGGVIDFTGNTDPEAAERDYGEVPFYKGLSRLQKAGCSPHSYTLTSDGQGSLPVFDEAGNLTGLGVGTSSVLLEEVKRAVAYGHPLDVPLRAVTENPARILKLANKGRIDVGRDADLLLLDKDLNLNTVIARGQIMVRDGNTLVHGTFENN
ncbi:beta-aspartyl-peptidase [Peptoniphilus equinus]|uniref:Isoaspartyl dipeptidase n=1 Tax=Peptoniphilus equinus TaxID=3016343 RepID=A0ABY7QUC5_9FIRM|nr:beta-aspartyl-peptidase [Peptoniphilus equinus]WBW50051.1 beta-aspartyl-peptidase [Peptoniphilus equinus]